MNEAKKRVVKAEVIASFWDSCETGITNAKTNIEENPEYADAEEWSWQKQQFEQSKEEINIYEKLKEYLLKF